MYAVTGASGRLGPLVIDKLLETIAAENIVALCRDPTKLSGFARMGVQVRPFDYDQPAALTPALGGVDRLLLISGSEVGRRERQHRAVIEAAQRAGVRFLAYTSVLHADGNPIGLAAEHRATEAMVRQSGLTYALLRHGWYTENTTANAAMDLAQGTVIGSAGQGRLSTATRADYAAGDAAVLVDRGMVDQVYELAGDESFTFDEYAAALSEIGGKPVRYLDVPEAEYRTTLERAGLPIGFAALLSEASARSADDVMFDESRTLSGLIGRTTTPWRDTLRQALGR